MYWANFFHIYQPSTQQPDIFEAVVGQAYRPLIEGTLARPGARYTLNINACLLEMFEQYGYNDLIEGLAEAGQRGQVELTGSAKYHALLPFLGYDEVLRQLAINTATCRRLLGDWYQPKGVFLPEMAYSPSLAPMLEEAGFEWVLLDEIAYNGQVGSVDFTRRHRISGTKLQVYFRERRLSNLIGLAAVHTWADLKRAMSEELASPRYLITGMDGETFGHHRPGLEQLLFEIFEAPGLNLATISELAQHYPQVEEVAPVACTWAASPRDIAEGIQFISWNDPDNALHKLQWRLHNLTLKAFYALPRDDPAWRRLRPQVDAALASDQFYWASARPWWNIEWIEDGAFQLLHIVKQLPRLDPVLHARAEKLYHQIVTMAFGWRRAGKLYQLHLQRADILRIPFMERTDSGTYRAFVRLMRDEEAKAVKAGNYEAATLWRDAVSKLEQKRDIYDAIHVVDLLRTKLPDDKIQAMLARYTKPYHQIRGGQSEQRDV